MSKKKNEFLEALAKKAEKSYEPVDERPTREIYAEEQEEKKKEHKDSLNAWFSNSLPPKPVWTIEDDEIVCYDKQNDVELERKPHPHPGKKFFEKFKVTIQSDVSKDGKLIKAPGDTAYAAVTKKGDVVLFEDEESMAVIAEGGKEGEDYFLA